MINFFDTVANTYDAVFTNTKIGIEQRNKVYDNIDDILSSVNKVSILELNCGTGIDAVNFAKKGHAVIATDISEEMIKVANKKNTYQNLKFKSLDIKSLGACSFEIKFDLIYSNFGGLNCLSLKELKKFIETASKLLNPEGRLILVLMPKNCIWERLYFLFKGDIGKMKRRNTNDSLLVNVSGVQVPTWYFNPKEVTEISSKNFTTTNNIPVGIAIPPSYLENSFLTKKPIWSFLKMAEKRLSNQFLSRYADHFLIELTKK